MLREEGRSYNNIEVSKHKDAKDRHTEILT